MEMRPVNGKENRKTGKSLTRLFQPLLIAACLFLWLVLTPMGQLIHTVVWWKTLSPQEANTYFALFSIAAALVTLLLNRKPKAEG
ncbi:hypothetical protein FE783_09250 [Paenibacillus mesophilus]|uniref:hypothetical protein n=1 Tax=Paenibacillus mesophilus TaxID=2582849 RepID=UPI00110F427A|nr:hypothetical protein [Paenibacillus mesophilus]TMV50846.1 hypothetical protein FE783_09250 [Paenibacillus mesophilus]